MRKIFYILTTFSVCALFGAGKLWAFFAATFILFPLKNINSSILWEIPMGVLISSIAGDVFANGAVVLLRVMIPIVAVLFAGFNQRKLFLFLPLAIAALILRNGYGIGIMCAAMWWGVKYVFIKNDCITKIQSLQGNNLTMPK